VSHTCSTQGQLAELPSTASYTLTTVYMHRKSRTPFHVRSNIHRMGAHPTFMVLYSFWVSQPASQENTERGCGQGCEWFALKTEWCDGLSWMDRNDQTELERQQ